MDPEVLSEAKDFVSGWIDKAGADGSGINYEVSLSVSRCDPGHLARLQRYQGKHGPLVWTFLALRDGRRLFIRCDPSSQINIVDVLCWQDRCVAL